MAIYVYNDAIAKPAFFERDGPCQPALPRPPPPPLQPSLTWWWWAEGPGATLLPSRLLSWGCRYTHVCAHTAGGETSEIVSTIVPIVHFCVMKLCLWPVTKFCIIIRVRVQSCLSLSQCLWCSPRLCVWRRAPLSEEHASTWAVSLQRYHRIGYVYTHVHVHVHVYMRQHPHCDSVHIHPPWVMWGPGGGLGGVLF